MTAAKFKDLVDMQRKAVEKFPSRRLFGTKRHSTWHWITYGEFGKQVDECRGGLKAAGIGEGDAVAIIAGNRVEWAVAAECHLFRKWVEAVEHLVCQAEKWAECLLLVEHPEPVQHLH